MFELSEPNKMVATMVRQWCQKNLFPALPKLESGEMLPYDLMRGMAKQFGL